MTFKDLKLSDQLLYQLIDLLYITTSRFEVITFSRKAARQIVLLETSWEESFCLQGKILCMFSGCLCSCDKSNSKMICNVCKVHVCVCV